MNLAQSIERRVEEFPSRIAIRFGARHCTYAEFWARVNRLGNGLKSLGFRQPDRVAVMLANSPELLETHWAVVKGGGTFTPINTMFKEKELRYVLNNSGARIAVTSTAYLKLFENVWVDCPRLEHLVLVDQALPGTIPFESLIEASGEAFGMADCDPGQTADLYYTSGTTGRPKGVMKTHHSLSSLLDYQSRLWKVTPEDRSLVVLPLFHSYAMIIPSMTMLRNGATQTILERWDTTVVLDTIARERITFFAGVPTMYTYMVRFPDFEKHDLTSLRITLVGGASVPIEVQREFEERARVRVLDAYGCTGWISSASPLEGPRVHGSIGMSLRDIDPTMDTDMKIVGEDGEEMPVGVPGELVVRGQQLPPGFWRMPDTTREAYRGGWFHTGDLCRKDPNGYFYLIDRKDDLIITSGYNVYPREVEEVLYTHPAVNECAVIGRPDPERGQVVTAFVALKSGATATAREIEAYCRERIANYKIPRRVEFIAEIPKTANGKLYKKGLRDL
ncbi:MAG: AMP-binding protein [Burkholderiales bacterium]|nr:AMP-binding protein [Burkholderiales bacterium]